MPETSSEARIGLKRNLVLALSIFLAACGVPRDNSSPAPVQPQEESLSASARSGPLDAAELRLGADEAAWLAARKASGKALRAAIRVRPDSYEPAPDGSAKGFDYSLVGHFASALGLSLELSVETGIEAFFTKDGVMPPDLGAAADYDFTPDLLKTVDLYVGPFAIVPWRQRLMTMVPIFPTRNQLAGRKGEEIGALRSLDGKRFAVVKDSIQHKSLGELARREGLRFTFLYANSEGELFDLVEEGKADYVLEGSVYLSKHSVRLKNFGFSPFPEEVQSTGWSVKKEDAILASILRKFLEASQASGLFGELWTRSYGMDFEAYLKALLWTSEPAKG